MSKDSIGIQEIIQAVAFRDGSLRDVYIFETSLEDWDRLLSLLKREYTLESEEFIPNSIREIIPIRQERGFLLRVKLLEGLTAHCNFYVCESESSPIEFDFDPREMQSPDSMIKVLQFMSKIGDGLNKDVFLTEENSETSVLLSYSSKNKIYNCFFQDHCYFNALQMGQISGSWQCAGQYSPPNQIIWRWRAFQYFLGK